MRKKTTVRFLLNLWLVLGCGINAYGQRLFLTAVPDNYLRLKGGTFDPYEGPKPLVVFVQTEPRQLVIGSETPRVALYDNGDLILRKRTPKGNEFRVKRLSGTALEDFLERAAPIHHVKGLKTFYNIAPNTTSQPRSCFYFRRNDSEVVTQVYGLMLPNTRLGNYTEFPGPSKPDTLPPELLEIHRFLGALDDEGTAEWTPKYIEVMLWPWGKNAPEEGVAWPQGWPDLNSDRALRGRDLLGGDVFYSIFVDGKHLARARAVLTVNEEAVVLGGRKWMFDYRYVFPSEPIWRKPFNRPVIDTYSKREK